MKHTIFQGIVKKTVTAAPWLNAPTPWLVTICTDRSDPCATATFPKPVARQLGAVELLGPVITADIPVLVGFVKPQGLVKIVAVTDVLTGIVLFLIFNTKPTIIAFTGITIVLVVNAGAGEEVPRPIHPPSLTD